MRPDGTYDKNGNRVVLHSRECPQRYVNDVPCNCNYEKRRKDAKMNETAIIKRTKRRQRQLNTFVRSCNGKGQSKNAEHCKYVKAKHPGCAVGCQKEFAPFREIYGKTIAPISELMDEDSELHDAFDGDRDFMLLLQSLHDADENWIGKCLLRDPVAKFCAEYGLTVPRVKYAQER